MLDDTDVPRIGRSPFAADAAAPDQNGIGSRMGRFASNDGVIPVAKPPKLWAPFQQPQKSPNQVALLNKTAPITANTRPWNADDSSPDGAIAALMGHPNGGYDA